MHPPFGKQKVMFLIYFIEKFKENISTGVNELNILFHRS